jgi:hypothetical protein
VFDLDDSPHVYGSCLDEPDGAVSSSSVKRA